VILSAKAPDGLKALGRLYRDFVISCCVVESLSIEQSLMRTDGIQLHNSSRDQCSMKCCYCPGDWLITALETRASDNQQRCVGTVPTHRDLYTNLAAGH